MPVSTETATAIVGQFLNLAVVAAVGRWGLGKLDDLREQYAEDREHDARANAEERAKLRAEIVAVEARCMAEVRRETEQIEGMVRGMERGLENVLAAIQGSPLHPQGLIAAERRNTRRRHNMMGNISVIDAKLRLLADLIVPVVRQQGAAVDPSVLAQIRQPIRWREMNEEEEPG